LEFTKIIVGGENPEEKRYVENDFNISKVRSTPVGQGMRRIGYEQ